VALGHGPAKATLEEMLEEEEEEEEEDIA